MAYVHNGGTDMVSNSCTIPKRKLYDHMLDSTGLMFSVCTSELERTVHTFSGNSLYHVEQGCASLMQKRYCIFSFNSSVTRHRGAWRRRTLVVVTRHQGSWRICFLSQFPQKMAPEHIKFAKIILGVQRLEIAQSDPFFFSDFPKFPPDIWPKSTEIKKNSAQVAL
jgi:hypothetical protein